MIYTFNRKKRIFLWLVIWGIIAAVFLPLISKRREIIARYNLIQGKLKQEQEKHQELLQKKDKMENDPFYLEKFARQKLGVTRDKEVLYKVITEPEEKDR